MTPALSLAHLTVIGLSPPEMVEVAARCGYQSVGLRLIRVTPTSPGYPLMHDKPMMRATKAAMARTGIGVLDIEFVKITPEIDVAELEPFVAAGAELGARHIITAPYDPDLARLSDRLGAIGMLAKSYGLSAVLEFFPWTVVPNLDAALQMVENSGREDVGILVDMLHFNRSGSQLAQFQKVPRHRRPYGHLCDAPVQGRY
ncbi:MAG: TIM barrel protein, partial [Hyphomicrobiales bacterium]|nr:TIM barrel protein [Hyphomicrobiales bacterium]